MAYMIQTGPDTFKFVSDEEEARQAQYMQRSAPPLPPEAKLSFSSPTEMAKMEAANAGNFDAPARKLLYETPLRYEPLREGDTHLGRYHHSPLPLNAHKLLPDSLARHVKPSITSTYGYPGQETTLAHEAAHGWYYEGMPKDTRNEYFLNVREMPGYEQYRQSYGEDSLRKLEAFDSVFGGMYQAMPTEIYAQSAMSGGHEIPQEWRDKYYKGLLAPSPKPAMPSAAPSFSPPPKLPSEQGGNVWWMDIANEIGKDNLRKGFVQPYDSGPRTYAQTEFQSEVDRQSPWHLR